MTPSEKTAIPATAAAAPVYGLEFEEEVEEEFNEEDGVGNERRVTASSHWWRRWRRRYPTNGEVAGKGMEFEGYFRYIN